MAWTRLPLVISYFSLHSEYQINIRLDNTVRLAEYSRNWGPGFSRTEYWELPNRNGRIIHRLSVIQCRLSSWSKGLVVHTRPSSTFEIIWFELLESTQARIFIYGTPGYDFWYWKTFKGRHHVTAFAWHSSFGRIKNNR